VGIFDIDLATAFGAGQVEIRFQPIVSLLDHSLMGVEALARLRDPQGRIWPPEHFVAAAERSGLAALLSERVVAQAIDDFSAAFSADCEVWLAINLPLGVFLDAASPAMVAGHALLCGLPAGRILIELTESQPVQDLGDLARAIALWQRAGFRSVLDDIDPGTHNLWQLLEQPFCAVKIDLALVGRLPDDPVAVGFVTRVVERTRGNGIKVVAEGVESEAMADHLRRLGVDQAQGFLISRPMRSTMLPAWWCTWPS